MHFTKVVDKRCLKQKGVIRTKVRGIHTSIIPKDAWLYLRRTSARFVRADEYVLVVNVLHVSGRIDGNVRELDAEHDTTPPSTPCRLISISRCSVAVQHYREEHNTTAMRGCFLIHIDMNNSVGVGVISCHVWGAVKDPRSSGSVSTEAVRRIGKKADPP